MSARQASAYTNENSVAYLLEARIVEPEKGPFLGNGSIARNNGITFGSGDFSAVLAETIYRGPTAVTEENPCGGGVEYLHRDPASRKRRRNGKSQI
jgi:hypothetical protein